MKCNLLKYNQPSVIDHSVSVNYQDTGTRVLARHDFEYLSEIYAIEVIARGQGVKIRHYLRQKYGTGRWRKLKGKAIIQYSDGKVVEAEIHWFEAAGIGRVEDKAIRELERRK